MNLEELVGEKLVLGIPGTKITPEIVRHFKDLHAGGLILYRINFESPAQIRKLISDLENALERKLLVTLDHEGGRVIMFGKGITVFPDSLAIGQTKNLGYAKWQGEIESKELRRLGMDVNLSPVLDVLTESYSPNIGIRSYGEDWRLVSQMGAARIKAMQKGGISACAKHFPGKGHAPVDAHLNLPTIQSTWKEMEATHLKPFLKAIEVGVDLIMSSHPYYPNLDPEPKNIASFSRKIMHTYLRETLGYRGIISSDDLEMGAIREICPIGEAAIKTTQAGHDLLLICHDLNAQKEVYRKLLEAYQNKELSIPELEKSVERIKELKEKRKKRFEGGPPHPEPRGIKIVQNICKNSVTFFQKPTSVSPSRKKRWLAIFPKFSELAEKIMIEEEIIPEEKFLKKNFKRWKIQPKIQIVSIEPSEEEIRQVSQEFAASDTIVYFCYDAHLYPSNKKLLDCVQKSGKEVIVVLLRDPYDRDFINKESWCLTDFGWRACQIKATLDAIGQLTK